MSTSKIYKTWCDRIDSGTFTKSECNQFAGAVARQCAGLMPHGKRTNLDRSECDALWDRIHDRNGVRLTQEHEQQGLRWLRAYGHRVFPDMPLDDVLSLFDHFLYVGEVHTYGEYDNGSLPIWRIVLSDGREIDYYNAAWQGGTSATAWWWVHEAEEERARMNGLAPVTTSAFSGAVQ